MWLVVSLTLARATFQIKLALVSRLYSWCVPGSLGHRAETSANSSHGVRTSGLGCLPKLSQQQMPARPVRGRPHLQTAAGGQEACDKDLRHGYGGRAWVALRRHSLVSRYSNKAWDPLWARLHSLAGLCNPSGMTRIVLQSTVARQRLPVAPPSAAASPRVDGRPALGLIRHDTLTCGCSLARSEHQSGPSESTYAAHASRDIAVLWTSGPG